MFNEVKPHFQFEDLDVIDIKDDQIFTPSRFIEPEKLTQIYTQAFIYDLLYKFAKEYLPDVEQVKDKSNEVEENKATDTTIDKVKEKVIEYLLNKDINSKAEKDIENVNSNVNIWNTDDICILRKNFDGIKGKEIHFAIRN